MRHTNGHKLYDWYVCVRGGRVEQLWALPPGTLCSEACQGEPAHKTNSRCALRLAFGLIPSLLSTGTAAREQWLAHDTGAQALRIWRAGFGAASALTPAEICGFILVRVQNFAIVTLAKRSRIGPDELRSGRHEV